MSIILFEDDRVAQLYPITIGRPAFAISCGTWRLVDLLAGLGAPIRWVVRPHLRDSVDADYGALRRIAPSATDAELLVNAAVVPSVESRRVIAELVERGEPGIVRSGERIAAALLPQSCPSIREDLTYVELAAQVRPLGLEALEVSLSLLDYPHDIVRHHLATIRANIDERLATGQYREVADGVFVADGAEIGQYVTTHTANGPILVESGARIGPYCYLSGPAYIGPDALVLEHAAIKDCVALGHTCKIGGEIEATIVEPYTNKQHHGFLGHSYLGSWINLGAGTCNSDLKNTYGQVNMEYQGIKVATGMQFIGCIAGDYAKTAINTGIFTGKTIGVCSMIYGFVTTNVPSFVNYGRTFGQVTEAPVEVMIQTQARMFARRNVTQRPCDVQLLRDMYEMTRHERQLAGEPLSL